MRPRRLLRRGLLPGAAAGHHSIAGPARPPRLTLATDSVKAKKPPKGRANLITEEEIAYQSGSTSDGVGRGAATPAGDAACALGLGLELEWRHEFDVGQSD